MSLPKRLPKEIADAQNDAMRASGIYYIHDEVNMRRGRAMIVGPEDTPYASCPLFFSFEFPSDYPFSPPAVTITTSDAVTRFHPNLYVTGKVCLSILGTWSGPKWAAVMTISTVLSSIQSLLEPNPITNEPGWEKLTLEDMKAKDYADYVQHALVSHSFRNLCRWKEGNYPYEWAGFEEIMGEHGDELLKQLHTIILERAVEDEGVYHSVVYNMAGKTDWKGLAQLGKIALKTL